MKYKINKKESPWGDYGDILIHGMACHLEREDDIIQLERTGPFVPSITFPGIFEIVVNCEFKNKLLQENFTGLSFKPVKKAKIVELHWENWDRNKDEPQYYPDSGEPEDYILQKSHSKEISDRIGDLWELVSSNHREHDFYRSNYQSPTIVSERVKDFLEDQASEYVEVTKV